MKRIVLLMTLLFTASLTCTYAQIGSGIEKRDKKRKSGSPFGKNRRDAIYSHSNSSYRPFGWFINPGATYMVGNSADDPSDGSYNLTPSGLPGYYAEVGLAFLMKKINKVVHYFDIGLGVKHFGGAEKFKSSTVTERGFFNFGSAFFRGAAHNVWQVSLNNFIDQSIGVNFDYRIYGGKGDDTSNLGLDPNPNKMTLQMNYSFGWGIKIRDGFFIIPTVQTPFLTFLPFDGLNPGLEWFSSKYQPTIFTVKFGWLFRKKGCPKVFDNGQGKGQSDQYQMQ
jgi:hypothetical protein